MTSIEGSPPYNPEQFVRDLPSGFESVVRELSVNGTSYVVKEPNPALAEKDPSLYEYFKTDRFLHKAKADYEDFRSVFGDIVPETLFVRGNDTTTGEPTNFRFQRKIEGQALDKELELIDKDQRTALVKEIRGQFLEIIWGCKEVMLKYGCLPDLHTGNLILDKNDGKLYFIDAGLLRDTKDEAQKGRLKPIMDRIERLEMYETAMAVTQEERARLDTRPGHEIDSFIYDQRVSRLKLARETLASDDNAPSEVLDLDPEAEKDFIERVKTGLDKFVARGGTIIMFDWDGTIRGNYPEIGIKNYIRRGFLEAYNYAKELNLKIGVCTLRSSSEVPDLSHLGITFDEYATLDKMTAYIQQHPYSKSEAVSQLFSHPSQELTQIAQGYFDNIARGEEPAGWDVLLRAGGEIQAAAKTHPNPKLLYMSARLDQGEKIFLVDDDVSSGFLAEKLGLGINVTLPQGYMHDKD